MKETERSYTFYDVPHSKTFEVWLSKDMRFEKFLIQAETIGLVHRKMESSRMGEGRAQVLARWRWYVIVHRSSVLEINEKTTFEALDVNENEWIYLFYQKSDEAIDDERQRLRNIRKAILHGTRLAAPLLTEGNYTSTAAYYMVHPKEIRAAFGELAERQ